MITNPSANIEPLVEYLKSVPFDVSRKTLYNAAEIYEGFNLEQPGSAGTMQEIFQDAMQNHYLSFGFSSPMIFLGSKFWREEVPVYPLLKGLTATGKYKNLYLTLTDDFEEIMQILIDFQELTKAHPEDFSFR